MNTYVFSDAERTEQGIRAFYHARAEFPHNESKHAITLSFDVLRSLVLFTMVLAIVNIAAILYIVSMWS